VVFYLFVGGQIPEAFLATPPLLEALQWSRSAFWVVASRSGFAPDSVATGT
jgi:hypothetical protein